MAKRQLYRKPRRPLRPSDGIGSYAPLMVPDATSEEVVMAVASLSFAAGYKPGIGREYNPIRDEYTMTGETIADHEAVDYKLRGEDVSMIIAFLRRLEVEADMGRIKTPGGV